MTARHASVPTLAVLLSAVLLAVVLVIVVQLSSHKHSTIGHQIFMAQL